MFAVIVQDRSSATLAPIIGRYVRPGSILHMDCWRGYRDADLIGMGITEIRRVNHSQHFVDPDTGVTTNIIEGNWWF